jgi:hypothetical protein
MKLRIKGNSIRLRLTKSDLDRFAKEAYLEEKTEFGNNTFTCALQISSSLQELAADYTDNKITVYMPKPYAEKWEATNEVGYSNKQVFPQGKELFILVEKDFKCIDGEVQEDQSDNFDNPLDKCAE